MEYLITGDSQTIDFAPQGVVSEVLQNVRTLISTKRFSVPLDRALGLEFKVLDRPLLQAQAALRVEIITAIRRWEPRAMVKRVDFDGDPATGHLIPKVTVTVSG